MYYGKHKWTKNRITSQKEIDICIGTFSSYGIVISHFDNSIGCECYSVDISSQSRVEKDERVWSTKCVWERNMESCYHTMSLQHELFSKVGYR